MCFGALCGSWPAVDLFAIRGLKSWGGAFELRLVGERAQEKGTLVSLLTESLLVVKLFMLW